MIALYSAITNSHTYIGVFFFFTFVLCILILPSFIYSPTDALVSCLENSIKIYIKTAVKIYIKTAVKTYIKTAVLM